MIHFRVRYERLADVLARRRWRVALWRALWLALLVPLAGRGLVMAGASVGWPLVGIVAAGVFLLALWRFGRAVSLADLGQRLDRRFGLAELMVTAVEVDRRGPRSGVETRLLDDAAMAVAHLSAEASGDGRAVRREVETTVAVALLLAGLWLISGSLMAPRPAPRLPALDFATLATGAGGAGSAVPGAPPAPGTAPGLEGIAHALGDQAVALEAVSALQAGDVAAAAREIRSLADRSTALSPAGRADLAEAMANAAKAAAEPALSRSLEAAAAALRGSEPDGVEEALARLATALDAHSVSPGARRGPAARTPAARVGLSAGRLRSGSTPVPLDHQAGGQPTGGGRSAGPAARTDAEVEAGSGGGLAARSAADRAAVGGHDPQAVPAALWPVIRSYFARESGAP